MLQEAHRKTGRSTSEASVMTPSSGIPPPSVLTPASLNGDEDDVVLRRNLQKEKDAPVNNQYYNPPPLNAKLCEGNFIPEFGENGLGTSK